MALAEQRPLLVLLTSSTCPSCEVAKVELDRLQKARQLDPCVFVIVNKDTEPEIAKQLIEGVDLTGTPILFGFHLQQKEWKRSFTRPAKISQLLKVIKGN